MLNTNFLAIRNHIVEIELAFNSMAPQIDIATIKRVITQLNQDDKVLVIALAEPYADPYGYAELPSTTAISRPLYISDDMSLRGSLIA